jgi:hypothetical protein
MTIRPVCSSRSKNGPEEKQLPPEDRVPCTSCGHPNTAHSRFCRGCGRTLTSLPIEAFSAGTRDRRRRRSFRERLRLGFGVFSVLAIVSIIALAITGMVVDGGGSSTKNRDRTGLRLDPDVLAALNDRDYVSTMMLNSSQMSSSLERMDKLLDSPVRDASWKTSITYEFRLRDSIYTSVKNKVPPEKYAEMHHTCVSALHLFVSASDQRQTILSMPLTMQTPVLCQVRRVNFG